MALHASIGAGTFSALAVSKTTVPSTLPTTAAGWEALFAETTDFDEIKSIREMPTFGTPANIVKVPQYGVTQSLSIGAQPDAPDLELTLNFVAADWAAGTTLADYVRAKTQRVFQFSLLYAKPASLAASGTGLGSVDNANIYFVGRMESLLIEPSLSDSNTATLALSIQSDFFGPFTIDPPAPPPVGD
jgi:hypothetical protein